MSVWYSLAPGRGSSRGLFLFVLGGLSAGSGVMGLVFLDGLLEFGESV